MLHLYLWLLFVLGFVYYVLLLSVYHIVVCCLLSVYDVVVCTVCSFEPPDNGFCISRNICRGLLKYTKVVK